MTTERGLRRPARGSQVDEVAARERARRAATGARRAARIAIAGLASLGWSCGGRTAIQMGVDTPSDARDARTVVDGARPAIDVAVAADADAIGPASPDAAAEHPGDGRVAAVDAVAADAVGARDTLDLRGADARDVAGPAADARDLGGPDTAPACSVDCSHLPHVLAGVTVGCRGNQCVLPAYACEAGFDHCTADTNSGCETALGTAAHCGSCSASCLLSFYSECRLSSGGAYFCALPCVAPTPDACDYQCADLQTDVYNCGACGLGCYVPNAQSLCQAGKCVVDACAGGWADCTSEPGCETQLGGDDNCGGCGDKACALANTLFTCSDGPRCDAAVCAPGFGNCDAASPDCESTFASAAACLPRYLDTFSAATQTVDKVVTAVAADGAVFLAGTFTSTVDFDPTAGRDIHTATDSDAFITKLNADGSYAWTSILIGRGDVTLTGLALTSTGAAVVTGAYQDTIDLDPSAASDVHFTATVGQWDPYVVELTGAGNLAWGRTFQGNANDAYGSGAAVAVDGADAVYVAGSYYGTLDFDPGPGTSSHTSSSGGWMSGMLVKLTATGAFQSARFVDDGPCNAQLAGVVLASDGNVWAAGLADSGSGCLLDDQPVGYTESHVLIVKHDNTNTRLGLWMLSNRIGSTGAVVQGSALAVAAGRDGSVYIGGSASGPLDFDPGPGVATRWLGPGGGGFVLKLDASGAFRWARVLDQQAVVSLAGTPDGGVVAAALQSGLFVSRLNPDGGAVWTFSAGGYGVGAQSVAANAGGFVVAGVNSGTNDFDPGPGADIVFGDVSFISRYQF